MKTMALLAWQDRQEVFRILDVPAMSATATLIAIRHHAPLVEALRVVMVKAGKQRDILSRCLDLLEKRSTVSNAEVEVRHALVENALILNKVNAVLTDLSSHTEITS